MSQVVGRFVFDKIQLLNCPLSKNLYKPLCNLLRPRNRTTDDCTERTHTRKPSLILPGNESVHPQSPEPKAPQSICGSVQNPVRPDPVRYISIEIPSLVYQTRYHFLILTVVLERIVVIHFHRFLDVMQGHVHRPHPVDLQELPQVEPILPRGLHARCYLIHPPLFLQLLDLGPERLNPFLRVTECKRFSGKLISSQLNARAKCFSLPISKPQPKFFR